ncbi:MAG: ABC transporter permease [Bacillota bacterium]
MRTGAWLGWQIGSNWTDPFLFAVYSIFRPVAQGLILVFMYLVISRDALSSPMFAHVYLGNAFFVFVGQVMMGVSWCIWEDREFFRTFRYIYILPGRLQWYVVGRAAAGAAIGGLSVIILLAFGRLFLGIPLYASRVNWAYFLPVFVLGILTCAALGMALAGVYLVSARHGGVYSEALAGMFYVLAGVVYPVDILPGWVQPLSQVLPLTWWIEGLRRACLGRGMTTGALAWASDGVILAILLGTALVLALVCLAVFVGCERLARQRGLLDMVTSH